MIERRKTRTVLVGGVPIGGDNPVVVQSMTNTSTADLDATVQQIIELAEAGSEIVRLTVNNESAAEKVPEIARNLAGRGIKIPLVGDFHFNGHLLLERYPECASALDKYRINPGNVGMGKRKDENFTSIIRIALENDKPVRIGVNWGSLDKRLLADLMEKNALKSSPLSSSGVIEQAMVTSALTSAEAAEREGLASDRIVLSAKVSDIPSLVAI